MCDNLFYLLLSLSVSLGGMLGRQTLQVSDGLPQGEAHGTLAEGAGQNETFETDEIRPRVQVTVQAGRQLR